MDERMLADGTIYDYDEKLGLLRIVCPYPPENAYILEKRKVHECTVTLRDGRRISNVQRKAIYSTLTDIALWSGHMPEETKAIMIYDYIAQNGGDYFSLSNCDMTTARLFLDHLIFFCIDNGVPCSESLLKRATDMEAYLYHCVLTRTCAICGKKADIHEWDRVGMGRDRRKMHHIGQRVQPLCRLHHQEVDEIGQKEFDEKYHIGTVRLDEYACNTLGWKG